MKGFIEVTGMTGGLSVPSVKTLVAVKNIVAVVAVNRMTEEERVQMGLAKDATTVLQVEGADKALETDYPYEEIVMLIEEAL